MKAPPKYPRVAHLSRDSSATPDDLVLSDADREALLAQPVVAEEKLDGANVVLLTGRLTDVAQALDHVGGSAFGGQPAEGVVLRAMHPDGEPRLAKLVRPGWRSSPVAGGSARASLRV